MKCDNCRYRKMCYRRYNPIGDKYSHTDNCEHYEAYKERQHGEWVLDKEFSFVFNIYECSKCRFNGSKRWHFCPNCGADMRKEGD